MVTNLDTGNNFERNELKDWFDGEASDMEKKVKVMKKNVDRDIDETFDKFRMKLMTGSKPDYELRSGRNLSIEKTNEYVVKLKSYGETCEVDLKTGKISYLKGDRNTPIVLDELGNEKILNIISSKDSYYTLSPKLEYIFWQMNVINRAISMSKKAEKKDFYFDSPFFWNFISNNKVDGSDYSRILKIDWENVVSIGWLRKWFCVSDIWTIPNRARKETSEWANRRFEEKFLKMLNKIVL